MRDTDHYISNRRTPRRQTQYHLEQHREHQHSLPPRTMWQALAVYLTGRALRPLATALGYLVLFALIGAAITALRLLS